MAMYIILLSFLLVIAGIFYIFIELLPRNKFRIAVLKLARIGVLIFFILGVVFIFVVMLIGGEPTPGKNAAYHAVKDDIQYSVTDYSRNHNGSLPILSGIYSNANCSNCSVINISAILIENGVTLRRAPDGLNLSASGNDNCGGNASLGCSNHGSYIWIVNASGDVFSYCAGTDCKTNDSGYQGVWP